MAKRPPASNSNALPTPTAAAPDAGIDFGPPPRSPGTARLSIPMLAGKPPGYVSTHLETQLDGRQSLALRRILDALDQKGARLANGLRIQTTAAAVRWLLEQLPEAHDPDYFVRNDVVDVPG